MAKEEVVLRFEDLSFEYNHAKPILDEVSFSVRKGSKITIMGQNGAGKSTIFSLITKGLEPTDGLIHLGRGQSVSHPVSAVIEIVAGIFFCEAR
jgi:ABC-type Mn2+/Zn2+ transport system ATPase subunit